MSQFAKTILDGASRLIASPEEELNRWQRTARRAIQFVHLAASELVTDRAPQMAAALAFRTIFSLVPVLVVGLVVLGSFYGPGAIEKPLHSMIDYLGLGELSLVDQGEQSISETNKAQPTSPGGADLEAPSLTVGDWIEQLVTRVQSLNFAAIGAVGVVTLLYAAFSLLMEVERAFNIVYSAPRGRRTIARLTQYWALLTLGPLGLIASFYMGERFGSVFTSFAGRSVGAVVTFIISWLLLTLVFTIGPNTRVEKRPALIGAFVGALLWEIGKWGFGEYLHFSAGYAKFYGSIGLLPVFMLWVYITWLIVLFGLELSYTTQTFSSAVEAMERRRRPAQVAVDPAIVLVLLRSVAIRFEQGSSITASDAAHCVGLGEEVTRRLLESLVEAGLLRRDEEGDASGYALRRPAESILLEEALRIGQAMASTGSAAAARLALVTKIRDAQTASLEKLTLADLVKEQSADGDEP